MQLKSLLQDLKRFSFSGDEKLDIQDIAYHTAAVRPGSCFVAIRGLKADGHRFVGEAVRRGAQAVVVEENVTVPPQISKIVVDDSRDALARLSAILFEEPSRHLLLVGITGTNGKTTTAHLMEAIWHAARCKPGCLSTVSYRINGRDLEAPRTTPESYDLQKMFRKMVDARVTHCVMEVTSHALDLKRVVGSHFDGAIFTNLTEDHLDFHSDMETYFSAKSKLFRERLLVSEKKKPWAVLNWDDPFGRRLAQGLPARVWRYSAKEKVEVTLKKVQADWKGLQMTVAAQQGELRLSSPLLGQFNALNILAAVTAALAMEIPMETIAAGIASFTGVPGRLQKISHSKNFEVFVDYAHTPQALHAVLAALKELRPRKLITVFGCGGNRDRFKRPMMGKIAQEQSDAVVVTSDNPRDEKPAAILKEIVSGMKKSKDVFVIEDRREAIAKALSLAAKGDCVLIAGKGHETYQETAGAKHPFDDTQVAKEILNGV